MDHSRILFCFCWANRCNSCNITRGITDKIYTVWKPHSLTHRTSFHTKEANSMLCSPCFDQVHSERLLHAHCIFAAPLLGLSYADLHPAHEGRALFHHLSRHNKRTHDLALTLKPRNTEVSEKSWGNISQRNNKASDGYGVLSFNTWCSLQWQIWMSWYH